MLKSSLIAALLAFAAIPAFAQYDRPMECWNPGAGHFEGVRPGEVQNDLDFGRCRPMAGYRNDGNYRGGGDGYYRGNPRDVAQECWNPGARHFEGVRPGEVQNDLDFSRCRPIQGGYEPRYEPRYYGNRSDVARECWNPRAGHFENVREGTYQNDLDYSRCRFR